jgi:hypothetical protein
MRLGLLNKGPEIVTVPPAYSALRNCTWLWHQPQTVFLLASKAISKSFIRFLPAQESAFFHNAKRR